MEEDINYYSKNEQQEAKKYFGEMIGAYMLQEQDEDNPKLVIRKDDIEKLKALLFMVENLINRNKELEENLKQEKMWRISLLKENEDICNEVNNNYIRKSKVEEVIKKVNESNGFSPVNKILIEQVLNLILKIGG